jgi:flagellar protein FliO/FliZ
VIFKTIGFGLVLSILFTSIASAEGNPENSTSAIASASTVTIEGNNSVSSSTEALLSEGSNSTIPLSTTSLLASLKDAKSVTKPTVSDDAIGRMFFGLGGVLILIFSCSWMLKRFNINKFGMTNSLSVSGVLPIGAKEKVVVVDIEGTRLVLGVTATNITKLHTLDVVNVPDTPPEGEKKLTASSDFSEKIKKIMKEGLKSD